MKKAVFAIIGTLVLATTSPSPARAECGEVSITEMNWASAAIVTAVSKFLMEQGYGCSVAVVPSSTVPAMTSIAETGEPDIATEIWTNTTPLYSRLMEQGKIVTLTDVLSDGGIEGWWIPDYLAEQHPELTEIEGVLANPQLVDGRFHNCPDGWSCRVVNDSLIQAFDLEQSQLEVFNHGSGETLATSIAAAYEDQAPWFGYYWGPTAVLGKYPMTQVSVGPHNAEVHDCNADPECEEVGKSAYPTSTVVTVATVDFADRQPEIAELMSQVSFSNAVMGEILAWQQDNQASADEAAVYFLSTYPDQWGSWLSDDARQRLSNLLSQ